MADSPSATSQVVRWRTLPRQQRDRWRRDAACRWEDPDLFFPVGSTGSAATQLNRAKAICRSCPVQGRCLAFAITTNQEFGVWGGCGEDERRGLRRTWQQHRTRAVGHAQG